MSAAIAPSPLVLIADDDRALRKLLNLALTQEGYRVVQVGSGEQVLEDFHRLQPDLVLLDAMMPDLDGFACCHHLRTEFKTPIPILVVTVLDDQDSIDRAFAVGATDFITKPIHWAVLRQRVKRLLQSDQVEKQAEQVQTQLASAQAWEHLQRQVLRHVGLSHIPDPAFPARVLAETQTAFQQGFQADTVWLAQNMPPALWDLAETPPAAPLPLPTEVACLRSASAVPSLPWVYCLEKESAAPTLGRDAMSAIAQVLSVSALLIAPIAPPLPNHSSPWGWLLLGRQAPLPWSQLDCDRLQDLTHLVAMGLRC